jgi:hypothetical protein
VNAKLAAAMARAGGEGLSLAIAKVALMSLPRAPTLSDSRPGSATRLPMKHTTPTPQTDSARQDAIAPLKSIAPPAI